MSTTGSSIRIGRLCMTESVLALVRREIVDVLSLLERHAAGDWGSVSEARKEMNGADLAGQREIISRYELTSTVTIVIFTMESCRITRCMQLGEFLERDAI